MAIPDSYCSYNKWRNVAGETDVGFHPIGFLLFIHATLVSEKHEGERESKDRWIDLSAGELYA